MMPTRCAMLGVVLMVMTMMQGGYSIGLPGGWGPCPQPPVQQDFDVNSYQGTWYEYQRFPVPYEALVICGQAEYSLINSTALSVDNSGVREISIAGRTLSKYRTGASGVATVPDPQVPAKLVVQFGGQIISSFAKGNYWVLATDYESYSLVYSCSALPFDVAHIDAAWILTRDRGVAPDNVDALKDILRNNGVDPSSFFTVRQTDCTVNSDPMYYVRGVHA